MERPGKPIYPALDTAQQVWGGAAVPGGHSWTGFGGSLHNLDQDFAASWAPFQNFAPRHAETVPGLSNGSANAPLPPTGVGDYNLAVRWSGLLGCVGQHAVDTPTRWQMSFCTRTWTATNAYGAGRPLTIDVTPRTCSAFHWWPAPAIVGRIVA